MPLDGMEEFRVLFGGVTLWQVVELGLALGFALALYKKVKNYILERHDAEQTRDEQLAKALDSINRYPEYRAQSLKIQQELRGEISELRSSQQQTAQRLQDMEKGQRLLECNKLRDRLLQGYRYYSEKQGWTIMEAEAFWALFSDYERRGGDGYMHQVVEPAMRALPVQAIPPPGDTD